MAITVIQTTPKAATSSGTVIVTFSSPTTAGSSIVAIAISNSAGGGAGAGTTCVDSKGNVYTLIHTTTSGDSRVAYFLCPLITTGGSGHTVTISGGVTFKIGTALEISSGTAYGLGVDQLVASSGTSTTPSTGTTPALTASEVVAIAAMGVDGAQASITVQSVSPTWTQVIEELPFTTSPCEVDVRVLTGVSGTTQSCSWTNASSFGWSAGLVCLKAETSSTAIARISQLPLEVATLSSTPIDLRLSQLPIEILVNTFIVPPTAAETTQFFIIA